MDYRNKVYTLTKDIAGQDAEIFMGIGLRARMLSEINLSSEKMAMIESEIIQRCENQRMGKK